MTQYSIPEFAALVTRYGRLISDAALVVDGEQQPTATPLSPGVLRASLAGDGYPATMTMTRLDTAPSSDLDAT